MFRIGHKVVCVDDSDTRLVVKGQIYDVEGIGPCPGALAGSLIVGGIRGNCMHGMLASRFRPIVNRKTDISIFTKMLTPQGVDA